MLKNLNARLSILLLVMAAALPILGLTVYVGASQRMAAEARERGELRLIAELSAKRPEQIIEGANQLLHAVAGNLDYLLRSHANCIDYFTRLSGLSGGIYRSMGIALPDGDIFCNSAAPQPSPTINIGDRYYFRLAMESRKFSVGEYQIGRSTRSPGLNLVFPVTSGDGSVRAVVFAGLNLETFIEKGLMQQYSVARGRVVTLFDRNGVVIAKYPGGLTEIGKRGADPQVMEWMSRLPRGVFSAPDPGGMPWVHAVETAGQNPDGIVPIRVLVSVPQKLIFAEAEQAMLYSIGGIVFVSLVVLLIAWFGADVLVLRRFRLLLDVAERLRKGDLAARAGLGGGREELAQLGTAFDAMAEQLQTRDLQLQEALKQLNEQAVTDQLTGLPNRRYLWDMLGAELARTRRKRTPLAVLLFDIDFFKQFNDRWGHEAGDLVLKNVAHVIRRVVRGSDIVARHGGEEFVIVLPEADESIALARAELLRGEIGNLRLTYGGEPLGMITVSVGVVCSRDGSESAEQLVRTADHAMYEAKQGGRNQVVLKAAKPLAAA